MAEQIAEVFEIEIIGSVTEGQKSLSVTRITGRDALISHARRELGLAEGQRLFYQSGGARRGHFHFEGPNSYGRYALCQCIDGDIPHSYFEGR